jgi:hypothetical protein
MSKKVYMLIVNFNGHDSVLGVYEREAAAAFEARRLPVQTYEILSKGMVFRVVETELIEWIN